MLKVLIIRFSSIGDIVLTTPVIRCVKNQKGWEVHYLTKEGFESLLRNNPYIDKIHTLENTLISELKKEKYDLIIDLHNNLRSHKIRWLLGVKSLSFHKANIEKWLTVNTPINLLPDLHLVDRYFEALKDLEIVDDGEGLDFHLEQDAVDKARQVTHSLKSYVCLNLGATYYTKRITSGLAESVVSKSNQPVILIGGQDTSETAELLNDLFPQTVINMCGKINLQTSAAIVKGARFLITGDSGMMHIGAAFQKAIYSIWGNTIPGFGMYPFYGSNSNQEGVILEVNDLSCRPCSKIGSDSCPKGHFRCMKDQDLSPIYDALSTD